MKNGLLSTRADEIQGKKATKQRGISINGT